MMEKIFELLFGIVIGLFGALIGLFTASVIISIVKVVKERITRFNIGRLTKKALEEDQRARNLLTEAIELAVKEKKGNTISISAFKRGKKVADIQLKGESVAEDIRVGQAVSLAVGN